MQTKRPSGAFIPLEEAKRSWPVRCYVLERNDFGMDEFMRLNLSDDDYAYYK